MIKIGLTGSIAMGKSTTVGLFAEEGVVVHDADAAVHALYAPGGEAVESVRRLFGDEVIVAGGVDRTRLKVALDAEPGRLAALEAAVHPLVAAARAAAAALAEADGAAAILFDVPLLFETGLEDEMDVVVVVTAPATVQRARALARPGMTEDRLEAILARQTPDAEKRRRADYLVDTSEGIEAARAQVRDILADLRSRFGKM